jgi:hypothetical protein
MRDEDNLNEKLKRIIAFERKKGVNYPRKPKKIKIFMGPYIFRYAFVFLIFVNLILIIKTLVEIISKN